MFNYKTYRLNFSVTIHEYFKISSKSFRSLPAIRWSWVVQQLWSSCDCVGLCSLLWFVFVEYFFNFDSFILSLFQLIKLYFILKYCESIGLFIHNQVLSKTISEFSCLVNFVWSIIYVVSEEQDHNFSSRSNQS